MMRRWVVAGAAAWLGMGSGGAADAQAPARAAGLWNDSATTALVARATARRAQQLADTGLRDYTARATGYLTFLGQIGEGFTEPPRIIKADQLALEVYWRAPDQSKQRIIGRRDSLLLPTDIAYHRDHLGIVQNNFPEIIRLGDGDEVRDVPHPLSGAGLAAYDFRIADSLRIGLPGRTLDVYEVKVRPRDDRLARVIGAVFLERDDAQVVRMAFSFTRAAFLDRQLEDLSIVLENGLVGGRFWLPRRQEIEIQRSGTWLDYPARGIIRGRWEIGSYALNQGIPPARFVGPEIVTVAPSDLARYPWEGALLDSLPPDVRATADPDVARVRAEARALVREEALRRGRGTVPGARGISDLLRFDRAEGLALGGSVTTRVGNGVRLVGRARYGFADAALKGSAGVVWERASGRGVALRAYDDFAAIGDVAERSGVVNTLAAQDFGSDHTDPYRTRGVELELRAGAVKGIRWRVAAAAEEHESLSVEATPAFGQFGGVVALAPARASRLALRLDRPTALAPFGIELAFEGELRVTRYDATGSGDAMVAAPSLDGTRDVGRGSFQVHVERPFGVRRVVAHTVATVAGGGGVIPATELALFGGETSGPGYDFHRLVGQAGFSQRLELQQPVRFPAVSLGRFGRSPAAATLIPFVHVVGISGTDAPLWRTGPAAPAPVLVAPSAAGLYPSVGVGFRTFFDLVRVDVARGLRDGRWTFGLDVSRDFWRVL